MSHELAVRNGKTSMARVAEVSCWWEGDSATTAGHVYRSNVIDPQTMTREQILQAGGLDYTIEQRAVFYGVLDANGNKKAQVVPNRLAQIHSDTQECLGIVSKNRYNVTQPHESYDAIEVANSVAGCSVRTLGVLKGGREWWVAAKMNRTINVNGVEIDANLVWRSGAWGVATAGVLTAIDPVCANTLAMALDGGAIRIPHSVKITDDIVKATLARLGAIDQSIDNFEDNVQRLIDTPVSKEQAISFYVDQYGQANDKGELDRDKLDKIMKPLMDSYYRSPGQDLDCRKGNAWGLVSGLTHFADHKQRAHNPENRFINSQWGNSAKQKTKAFNQALAFAKDEAPLTTVTGEEYTAQLLDRPVSRPIMPRTAVTAVDSSEFDALLGK